MDQLFVVGVLALLGLGMGSFAGATVWRLRARQLVEDKAVGGRVSAQELKRLRPLTKVTFSTDRSRCLHCHHVLAWHDLIPLVSWLSTSGKCRYCHAKIGWFEPLIEIGVAIVFVSSYLLWPVPIDSPLLITQFLLWLAGVVALAILFAYDLKWYLLPNTVMFPLIFLATVYAVISLMLAPHFGEGILTLCFAISILSGLYLVLWLVSKGRWIGFGDVKLGLALALFLANWELAFVALFAANFLGCLLVLPGFLLGKVTRGTRVPFGPLLIVGGIVAMLIGDHVVDWYTTILLY